MSTPHSTPQLLTLRGLAKAIGVDAGQLSKESGRPGFPGHATADGTLYDAAEVIAWRQANVRRKKPSPALETPPAAAPSPAPSPAPPPSPFASKFEVAPVRRQREREADAELHADDDASLLATLRSGQSSALEISRAVVQIASRRVARAHRNGGLGPNDLDGLKKSLQELRTAEADYIELEKSRRGLIARDEVRSIVAEICGRLVRVLGVLENSIATEFSVWLADPKTAEMGADERARLVRDFVSKTTRAARTQEADDIDRLVDQPRED